MSSGVPIPSGYSLPFAVVTDNDHTAWIIIAAAIGLSWILLFAGIRIFIRRTISPGFGFDDGFIAAATTVGIIELSIILAACSKGLGKSIDIVPLENRPTVQEMYYTSNLLFIISLGLSKLSVVFFLLRLTHVKWHRIVFISATGLLTAWTIGSLFAIALQCNLTKPWIMAGERCTGAYLRWQIICALDIISEVGLVAMSICLVWDLYTSVTNKIVVVGAFVFRLGMIVAVVFRLANFDKPGRITDPTLAEDLFIVWTQTELIYSLVSATIPTLRPFMNNLNTRFGGLDQEGRGNGYDYENASDSYQMSNLKPMNRSQDREEYIATNSARNLSEQSSADSYGVVCGCPIQVQTRTREETGNGDATSADSNDNGRMIIQKDMTFQVEHYDNC
ncbi:uncharacterized protein Z518_05772 [Rhinocladiella mackenziei CBS 650.93]|uniref:Rhodopsin domain-containing protein n=1 Tax=Rhinocladiella mackenziei CBS 650.93 TaxID=1442369 RepID=A0A0D2IP28_9EURO|nr:uncharacterized protein Z518_05772 [Rhinocladiella mackenziei CBS 650.93]KIX04901.1 hypothetical protein Z518_05772 [Rhinocladiella mackenziei CBS 650.93]